MTLASPVVVRRLGRVEYADGLAMQDRVAVASASGISPDTLLLLEHDPVLTLGRGVRATGENILIPLDQLAARGVELHHTGRGGDVTFHGPGQIVGYPIFNLGATRETRDVRKFVRSLEEVMIRTCADLGIQAARVEGLTGVWVGRDKIGAIGVRVSKWITTHGFALNVGTDLSFFDLIVPCGIRDRGVTSISALAGRDVAREEVEDRLELHTAEVFGRDIARKDVDQTTIGVVVKRGPELLALHRVPRHGETGGGFWQIVTGKIETGETARDAAMRELKEETGFAVPLRPLYEHAFVTGGAIGEVQPHFAREIVFVAEVSPRVAAKLSDEHDDLAWLSLSLAVARVRHPGHKRALRLAE